MWKTSVTCTAICSQIDRGIPFSVYPSSAPHPGRYNDKTMFDLDPTYDIKVNSTRLKERLLGQTVDLRAQKQGKDVVLLFDADMSAIVSAASQGDTDAFYLARAAQIVRRDISSTEYAFDGTFDPYIEDSVVSPSLCALIDAFSAMAMDQAHEQLNEQMKADGGIVGLTDNPTALLRWITAGLEVQRILHEFENSFKSTNEKPKLQHHEQTASFPRGRRRAESLFKTACLILFLHCSVTYIYIHTYIYNSKILCQEYINDVKIHFELSQNHLAF